MDQINELLESGNTTSSFDLVEILVLMALAFGLTAIVALVYKLTYEGVAYNKTLAQSLVMLGMLVAVVMAIVGTNIATAFTLVGALSIVRFRNAVKETRDVGFIFFAMVIGMAVGSQFYLLAAIATVLISLVIGLMFGFNWYDDGSPGHVLKLNFPADHDPTSDITDLLDSQAAVSQLISLSTLRGGSINEYVYSVTLSSDASPKSLVAAANKLDQTQKVSLFTGFDQSNL